MALLDCFSLCFRVIRPSSCALCQTSRLATPSLLVSLPPQQQSERESLCRVRGTRPTVFCEQFVPSVAQSRPFAGVFTRSPRQPRPLCRRIAKLEYPIVRTNLDFC